MRRSRRRRASVLAFVLYRRVGRLSRDARSHRPGQSAALWWPMLGGIGPSVGCARARRAKEPHVKTIQTPDSCFADLEDYPYEAHYIDRKSTRLNSSHLGI